MNRARGSGESLSGVVESLLADYVVREQGKRGAKPTAVAATVATRIEFADEHGSIADEHSTR